MPDELKKILSRELDELRQNKIRFGVIAVCFVILLIFWATDDNSDGEEIILTEKPPLTKDLPVKVLPVEKSSDGVKIVLGANADALFIGDPFAVKEKKISDPPSVEPPPLPEILTPEISLPPPPRSRNDQLPENFFLMGTAISGENKTAMFLLENETLFLTIGEEICKRKISDITSDFVIFDDGERIYFQKELN